MWYYIVFCATFCVSFLSKLKATNVFPKHILKVKARDQSIQARKKLLCHGIVTVYLCNVSCKLLIKMESTWRLKIKEQTSQLTLRSCNRTVRSNRRRCSIKKAVRKNFRNIYKKHLYWSLFLKKFKAWRPAT